MINLNNIFDSFEESDSKDTDEVSLLVDFSEHPLFWIGGFNKVIHNHVFFTQYTAKTFKNVSPELDLEDLEKVSEHLMYTKAWEYIKDLDTNNPFHVECIKMKASNELFNSLVSAIKHFEPLEEYEKCARLKNIEVKVKEFLT